MYLCRTSEGAAADSSAVTVVKEKNTVLHFIGCGPNPTWESMKVIHDNFSLVIECLCVCRRL